MRQNGQPCKISLKYETLLTICRLTASRKTKANRGRILRQCFGAFSMCFFFNILKKFSFLDENRNEIPAISFLKGFDRTDQDPSYVQFTLNPEPKYFQGLDGITDHFYTLEEHKIRGFHSQTFEEMIKFLFPKKLNLDFSGNSVKNEDPGFDETGVK